MIIIQHGPLWKCINDQTGITVDFIDVNAIPRFAVALNSGLRSFMDQLAGGNIFRSVDSPAAANVFRQNFLFEDNFASMVGWSEEAAHGQMSWNLIADAETLADAIVAGAGLGTWMLLVLGLGELPLQISIPTELPLQQLFPANKNVLIVTKHEGSTPKAKDINTSKSSSAAASIQGTSRASSSNRRSFIIRSYQSN
jgi:hypothetical protein